MKKSRNSIFLFFIVIPFIFFLQLACKKNIEKQDIKLTTIRGKVIRKDNNQPVVGAIVTDEKGLTKGDTTKGDGQFVLTCQFSSLTEINIAVSTRFGPAKDTFQVNPGIDTSITITIIPAFLAIKPANFNILLPDNCSKTFTIYNTGATGSNLVYKVVASDSLENKSGSDVRILAGGDSASFTVSEKSQYVNNDMGSNHSIKIYTGIVNNTNNSVSPEIAIPVKALRRKDFTDVDYIIGNWSGIWTGATKSLTAGSNVAGEWILTIDSINKIDNNVSGTLLWTGWDIYNEKGVNHTFYVSIKLQLGSSNTNLTYSCPTPGKPMQYNLEINPSLPLDSQYGPKVTFTLLSTGEIAISSVDNWASGCSHCPGKDQYSNSSGKITGMKN